MKLVLYPLPATVLTAFQVSGDYGRLMVALVE